MSILAIPFPTYQQAMRIISNITNDSSAQVTTTFDHQYKTGLVVRLYVPNGYGMVQVNQLAGSIVVVDDITFNIDIDTRYFDVFIVPITYPENAQYPTVVPIGEINANLDQATKNVLPYSAV